MASPTFHSKAKEAARRLKSQEKRQRKQQRREEANKRKGEYLWSAVQRSAEDNNT